MSSSFVYGFLEVTAEMAKEALDKMDTVAKAMASAASRAFVALPMGLAMMAGGFLASETMI